MAALTSTRPTLIDVARATDPTGKIAKVAHILQQYNSMNDDIPWYEGNTVTGNITTVETSKAAPVLRLLNQGVVSAKSTTGQIVDACSIIENRQDIDVNVAALNGNAESYRALQDKMMIQGFADAFAKYLIYGDVSTDPAEFNGLAARYFSLGSTFTTSSQMIDAGGTGSDNTSIWLVCYGPDKVYGMYPKGSTAGLQVKDLGIQDVITNFTTGARMRAYSTWMQWMCGLVVADYRAVVRICNIDMSNLRTASNGSDTSANIMKFMSQALDLLPPGEDFTPVFYMNREVRGLLRIKMQDKSNLLLADTQLTAVNSITRRPALTFQGVPCRAMDAITKTEATIDSATT